MISKTAIPIIILALGMQLMWSQVKLIGPALVWPALLS